MLGEDLPYDGHYENLQEAARWGFKISHVSRKVKTLQEIFDFINYWDVERKNLPVATDGIVLKNADIIASLDLHIGDNVYVEKGGEIIPKITGVDVASRPEGSEKVTFITHCPECGSPLVRYEDEAAYYCTNESSCPPQIKGKIEHFISRRAMNIEGLGPETVDQFYQEG